MLQVDLQDSRHGRGKCLADRRPPEFADVELSDIDRLEFTGTRALFLESDPAFDPAPNERLFPARQGRPYRASLGRFLLREPQGKRDVTDRSHFIS